MATRIRPIERIEVVSTLEGATFVLLVDPPETASSPGSPGTIAWDETYIYVCIADDTWVRAALETW